MKLKFNDYISIEDFENGKIVTVLSTKEGYYIDSETWRILEPLQGNFLEIDELDIKNYDYDEFVEFINLLLKYNILKEVIT